MLGNVKKFIFERKQGFTRTATILGGAYVVRRYVRDRLDEVKDRLEQERMAKENLKRRFEQTQDDTSYTILALVQTLSEQILGEMDVEALTLELQSRSKARKKRVERPPSTLSSSIDMIHDHDARSEADSAIISIGSASVHELEPSSPNISTSGLRNWVESSVSLQHPSESSSGGEESGLRPDSTLTTNTENSAHNVESSSVADSAPSDSLMSSSVISESSNTKSTAELWSEVKTLTFTRTLTTLYSTTLLTLLSLIQLTLLARAKYIQSIIEFERDERMREHIEAQFSWSNILFASGKSLEGLLSGDSSLWSEGDMDEGVESISEEVESKFLTMSWWILHVGWKDVGERVRRGVEEAFEGVSLKSKLSAVDVHRLISDVRRRVEHEVTFEGNERRINFLSCLLPPTPETVQHVLLQGGFSSPHSIAQYDVMEFDDISAASSQISQLPHQPITLHPYTQDANFSAMLDEMRRIIASSNFAHVLELCLDRATDMLFQGLDKSVFVTSEAPTGEAVRIRLAGLLPGLARWSQLAMNGIPNELVDSLLNMREVECLSAIVFSEFEGRIR